MSGIFGLSGGLRAGLAELRGQSFLWLPVWLACGIGLWFSVADEPGRGAYSAAIVVVLAGLALRLKGPEVLHPIVVALSFTALGFLAVGTRAHLVEGPGIDFRYYGPIQGRIVEIDRSQSDALRLTLDRVVLDRVSPAKTPRKVRVSLHDETMYFAPEPGQVVALTGHLSRPEGPVEPGGFDFQRMAFFMQLGAVGYSRTPTLLVERPDPYDQIINRWRTHISNGIMASVPGDAGAFSSGVMTGDRSGISLQATEDLRKSSLAHLLAISGMNMAFLTAFVFALIRYGVALIPWLALRVNSKKVAAVVALAVAWFYLQLSGANVATERAFIMASVILGAVLLDRRALSLRTVALSAILLLLVKPEGLLEPGFQMSFAATAALIAGFAAVNANIERGRVPRWVMPVFTLVMSSLIAGVATGPYGAAHFNRIAGFGFFANLLTVPVMGAVVMPFGSIAALLAPFGLADLPLWIMGLGSRWILFIAHEVAALDGSVTAVITPGPWVLPLITLGGMALMLWPGRVRMLGALPVLAALMIWSMSTRPALLIASDAGLVGVMTAEGRAMSAQKGGGFAAKSWLENDGDLAIQATAATRAGFSGASNARSFMLGRWRAVQLKGKAAPDALPAACASADLVIIGARIEGVAPKGCQIIDWSVLDRTGPLAVWLTNAGDLRLEPTKTGQRIWMGRQRRGNEAKPTPALLLASDTPSP